VLELPIEVVAGSIGKISLKIPWSSLSTNPVVISLEDVFIVALPLSHRLGY
jgi:vacuolar protein sorting-associated protein 13A/C